MTRPTTVRLPWPWLGPIMVFGFALRVAAGHGGLWLDEAWSAKLARDAGTPLGIFLNINHDNNHHLNSLWLQFVGFDAPPVLDRALSIVTGTLAIWVAAMIAAPRGRLVAVVTAWLFAVSPVLVTLGSEARGYAAMALALLSAILIVDRRLTDRNDRPEGSLALCFGLGTLAQMTMLFGICAVIGWYLLAMWRRVGFAGAVSAASRLFLPALLTLAVTLGLIFVPARLSPTGFQFGSYTPFDSYLFLHGVIELLGYTLAWPINSVWLLVTTVAGLILARSLDVVRLDFYRLAIVAFPLALALLHAGNVGHPRYYLVAGLALLLLLGEALVALWRRPGWRRWLGAVGLVTCSVPALALDIDLIRNQRGDPAGVIDVLHERAPRGGTLLLERNTALPMVELAAAQAHYPLHIQETPCPPGRFLLVDRFRGESFPASVELCGAHYWPIEHRTAHGMSGLHWTLYERQR